MLAGDPGDVAREVIRPGRADFEKAVGIPGGVGGVDGDPGLDLGEGFEGGRHGSGWWIEGTGGDPEAQAGEKGGGGDGALNNGSAIHEGSPVCVKTLRAIAGG